MANKNLKDQRISSTYSRLVQLDPDNGFLADGSGSNLSPAQIDSGGLLIKENSSTPSTPPTNHGQLFASSSNSMLAIFTPEAEPIMNDALVMIPAITTHATAVEPNLT